jgi:DNA-binding XRE family transcriptional regulator
MNKVDKRFGIKKDFTASEIRQIRENYLAGATQQQLASDWGVSQKTIAFIIKRYTYSNTGIPNNYEARLKVRMNNYWGSRYRRKDNK